MVEQIPSLPSNPPKSQAAKPDLSHAVFLRASRYPDHLADSHLIVPQLLVLVNYKRPECTVS